MQRGQLRRVARIGFVFFGVDANNAAFCAMLKFVAHDASTCTRPVLRQPFKSRAEAGLWIGEHKEIGDHGLRYIIPAQGRLELRYCEPEADGIAARPT